MESCVLYINCKRLDELALASNLSTVRERSNLKVWADMTLKGNPKMSNVLHGNHAASTSQLFICKQTSIFY